MFKLSSEANLDGAITVEHKFIVEYMPYADGDYVKVYLYGLSLAARKGDGDDTIERLSKRLGLDMATVDAAIEYWTNQGLMARLGDDVTYLSLRTARPKIKKYDVDKYAEFNRNCQLFVTERQIAPREYDEYYAFMEKFDVEWQAMVAIVRYCTKLKGGNVSSPYILAVARNLVENGYRTRDEIENRLEEYGVYYNDLLYVLAPLGKSPDHESVALYKKWTVNMHFEREAIRRAAELTKKGGIAALDGRLTTYCNLGLFGPDKITAYEDERHNLIKLTKAVNKSLGVFYENVETEITMFIRPWLDLGFDKAAILAAADYCMQNGLKTMPDLDAVIRELFRAGITTEKEVRDRQKHESRYDERITDIMNAIGLKGAVRHAYRTFYSNWVENLKMPDDVIDSAASLSVGMPFSYMNTILNNWSKAGVDTVEKAKAQSLPARESAATNGMVSETISAEELNKLFIHYGDDDE
ncbi:MAG: DnaD domain protein [Clostridiales bacterium]|nr:DnaD domain protein [Clostridiales bacterium]